MISFTPLRRAMSVAGRAVSRPTAAVLARSAEMRDWIHQRPSVFRPSRFWHHLSTEDDKILRQMKIENFKRCLPQHYFNWPVDHPANPQFATLLRSWISHPSVTPLRAQLRGSARVIHVPAKLDQPPKEWLTTPEGQQVYTLSSDCSGGTRPALILTISNRDLQNPPSGIRFQSISTIG